MQQNSRIFNLLHLSRAYISGGSPTCEHMRIWNILDIWHWSSRTNWYPTWQKFNKSSTWCTPTTDLLRYCLENVVVKSHCNWIQALRCQCKTNSSVLPSLLSKSYTTRLYRTAVNLIQITQYTHGRGWSYRRCNSCDWLVLQGSYLC